MSGQTLNDRLTAAKHALAGQGLARIVCKATTEEVIGPKRKHLDYLLHCTNEPNVSIPQLANLLIERTQHTSWVVVFKALITVHHLMCYGNERFTQYLASSNCTFQLGCFLDKVGVQSYDMSTFIRRYAKYLNEKAVSYRTVAFDFCKCKRGKEDGILRQMNTEQLLKTLPALQAQLDALLEFDCSTNDLCNGVVNACFVLLFRDLIRLFACYNDGIINLLEKYFNMNKKHARDALDIYKKFLIRMDRVAEFLKVAENVGIDKGEIPDLTKAPSSLLEALEQHLAQLEGRKGSTSAASVPASTDESTSAHQDTNGVKVDESVKKAMEEEAEVMNILKFDKDSPLLWEQPAWEDSERRLKEMTSTGENISVPSVKTNPFLPSPEPLNTESSPMTNQRIIDLFNASGDNISNDNGVPEDSSLLNFNNNSSSNPFAVSLFDNEPLQDRNFNTSTNGFGSSDAFASEASFAAAFGDSPSEANQGPLPDNTSAKVPAAETSTAKLSLPVTEPFGGRSTSPSPTNDLMRGAGTTPILANVPEGGFGEAVETTEEVTAPVASTKDEASDFIWGNNSAASTPVAVTKTTVSSEDPFGAPFEPATSTPSVPTAVVTPLSVQPQAEPAEKVDLFGFESGTEFDEQPMSTQPCAPPPSPFGGLDINMSHVGGNPASDLRAQAIANAVGVALPMSVQPKPAGGIEDLNFVMQQVPLTVSPTVALSGAQSPFAGQTFSPVLPGLPVGSGTPPPTSASLTGVVGTPSGRASSSPGYSTPPSGMSSPAKMVSSMGHPMPGAFDAFGETLQSQPQTVKTSVAEKSGSSILKGDLDSTLASLASNLDINGPKQAVKKPAGHQWGSPKPPLKTSTWTAPAAVVPVAPGAASSTVGWPASPQPAFPMGQPTASATQWAVGSYPHPAGTGVFQPQPFVAGGSRPMAAAPMAPVVPMQQSMYTGSFLPQVPLVISTNAAIPSKTTPVNDPFGAL